MASSNALLKKSRFDLTRNSIFCCKWQNYFPIWQQWSKSKLLNMSNWFLTLEAWRHKMFKFPAVLIGYIFAIINPFSWVVNASPRNAAQLQWLFDMKADWHTNLPQVHDLIMYELEVQVIVSLESYWVLTLDTCYILL